jgi:transcriptional regulator with XRE-family HTH domain
MSTPPSSQYDRDRLSAVLRALRSASGLTSREAAAQAGFSQSKLSKVENGALLPSYDDGQALCRVYRATPRQRDEVLDLLRALHDEVESARVILQRGAYRRQREIAQIEAQTVQYRDLQIAYVSGLLQTADYIRRMASQVMSPGDREKHVAARLERQRVLEDTGKSFTFVMTEGAVRWRAGSAELMAAQVEHIIETSRRPNVEVGVIPWSTEAPPGVMPGHEVHIYDERMVIVGIQTATATIQDPRDIEVYLQLFEAMRSIACFGAAARRELERIAADYTSRP